MAMLANIHRGEDSESYSWDQFHPMYDAPEPPEVTADILIAMGFKPMAKGAADGS